jgi:hypothetical protein
MRKTLAIFVALVLLGLYLSSCNGCDKDRDKCKNKRDDTSSNPLTTEQLATEEAQDAVREAEEIRRQVEAAKGWEAKVPLARKAREVADKAAEWAAKAKTEAGYMAAYKANDVAASTWGCVAYEARFKELGQVVFCMQEAHKQCYIKSVQALAEQAELLELAAEWAIKARNSRLAQEAEKKAKDAAAEAESAVHWVEWYWMGLDEMAQTALKKANDAAAKATRIVREAGF